MARKLKEDNSLKSLSLSIESARENNLKGIDLEIPHDRLTVVTGLSGSGKSSLAFETVYAEGQRRYIETFSPYTRLFFDRVKKPELDRIDNVRPAIAIQQRTRVTSSRSTVGSLTDINDYLKVLWANISKPVCPSCSKPLKSWSPGEVVQELDQLQTDSPKSTFLICAIVPLAKKKKEREEEIEKYKVLGFSRYLDRKNNDLVYLEDHEPKGRELCLAIDRVKAGKFSKKRAIGSLEQAYGCTGGYCTIIQQEGGTTKATHSFSKKLTCEECDCTVPKPTPALFSSNHPHGACAECKGFGKILTIDPDLCVPDPTISIKDKAMHCWSSSARAGQFRKFKAFCEENNISVSSPWKDLPEEDKELIFNHNSREFKGVHAWFKRLERKIYKMHVRVFLSRYRSQTTCPSCGGKRFQDGTLCFHIEDRDIAEISEMEIAELSDWISNVQAGLPRKLREVAKEVHARLSFLADLGLSYLTLNREARTLSGGETQRVNLVAALGSNLTTTQFVLDEPSVGLHPRDTARLLRSINSLRRRDNSVLMVEHDLDCIAEADQIIEMGPGAGNDGGQIVYSGEIKSWKSSLLPESTPKVSKQPFKAEQHLVVTNASARNLKGFDLKIPLQSFVTLTGVSGSGKSTLVSEVLLAAFKRYTHGMESGAQNNSVEGFEQLDQVLLVDQAPLAKSPRANIATYTKIWDSIRELLASTSLAMDRALGKGAFSFNVDGGRCPACKGAGHIKEDMQFLSDVYIPCEVCLGKRFQQSVLEITHDGKNVDDFLNMTVDEAAVFFHGNQGIRISTETLGQLGLGHLRLGHSLSDLSGGEAQRLKLVPFVSKGARGASLLIFDEPTTGLHLKDVERLIELFLSLKEEGHSILCVEHNLPLIAASDWIIDLGPEGGREGGELVLEGTPASFVKSKKSSYTAEHLSSYLNQKTSKRAKRKSAKTPSENLSITGARVHNLKNINITLPLNQIVALTGVSGSGKSSIAKDIIHAESQRRYVDCLSPYARQFIKELEPPDIDKIENLSPTVCIQQHTNRPGKLSTVGTLSETYNYLRLLYAKIGTQHCPKHPKEQISPLSNNQIAENIREFQGPELRLLAPIIKKKKGIHRPIIERAIASEIMELRVNGDFCRPSDLSDGLARNKAHTIEYTIAKCNPANLPDDILEDAVTQALGLGGGTMIAHANGEDYIFSVERTCSKCKTGFFAPDPEDLSFHSRRGACDICGGTGRKESGAECSGCKGARLGPNGRNIKLSGYALTELCLKTPPEILNFLKELELAGHAAQLAEPIISELEARLKTLSKLGIDYIELNRSCSDLSSGELQRLRLATALGSPLTGVMYILDEPSVGLHPDDNQLVLKQLKELKQQGNSVVMIEHDRESILSADHIIEVGPGGGRRGGKITFSGSRKDFRGLDGEAADSLSSPSIKEKLTITKGARNNINDLCLKLPLNQLVSIVGVSGAGKSSLVHGILVDGLESESKTISTSIDIDSIKDVDQKPIGKQIRSTPASYLGVWDEIRKLFAQTVEARTLGWNASYFSYNSGGGRCPECEGRGIKKLEMSFLADAQISCERCHGDRYSDEAKSITYLGLSIGEALSLTFEEARDTFKNHRKIYTILHQACELGLGYLSLGQGSATLSGGESQRVKLVAELCARQKGHILYVLDEPTTGLHHSDVARLVKTLRELVAKGNSVIVIEHDRDLILQSDHVVELGPRAGAEGGKVVFQGTPLKMSKADTPWGRLLQQ